MRGQGSSGAGWSSRARPEAPPRFAEPGRETERQCSASRYAEPFRAVILGLMLPAKEQPGVDAVIRSVFVAQ